MVALFAAAPALAFDPFVVKDIRVEGIQRTEAGTVFNYLPVRVGETFTEAQAADAIRALFATGFFSDVRIETEGDVIVVAVRRARRDRRHHLRRRQGVRQGRAQEGLARGRPRRVAHLRPLAARARGAGAQAPVPVARQVRGHGHHDRHAAGAQPSRHQLQGRRGRRRPRSARSASSARRPSRRRICSTRCSSPRPAG